MPSTSTTSSLVADEKDSGKVDTVIRSGASTKDMTRCVCTIMVVGLDRNSLSWVHSWFGHVATCLTDELAREREDSVNGVSIARLYIAQ